MERARQGSLAEELESLSQRVAALEAEQRQTVAMFRSLVETVPDIIYRVDREGKILFISEAVRKYGYDPAELIGTNIFDLIHPEDRGKAVYRVNERRAGERRTRALELRLFTRDHDPITFEFKGSGDVIEPRIAVSASGVYTSDQPQTEGFLCTQGVARDITDRVKAENLRREAERARVLSETAGAAAHEISQPLTAIVGNLELVLAEMGPEAPGRQRLENALSEAGRISQILQKMQSTHRYATKPYAQNQQIADFDAASREEEGTGDKG